MIDFQRDDGTADIADYEDYPVSDNNGSEEESGKDRKERDSDQMFDPNGFEKYFRRLEDGIEDEVQVSCPNRK